MSCASLNHSHTFIHYLTHYLTHTTHSLTHSRFLLVNRQVPCPYLHVSASASSEEMCPLPPSALEALLRDWQLQQCVRERVGVCGQDPTAAHDPPPVELVEEEHPLLGTVHVCIIFMCAARPPRPPPPLPHSDGCHVMSCIVLCCAVLAGGPAACLHICGLPERLALLQTAERARQEAEGRPARLARTRARRLYLLQWFGLAGPLLGQALPPRVYQSIARRLLERGDTAGCS